MKCTPLILSIILFRRQKKVETWTQLNKVKLRIKSWQMTEEAEETKHKCMRYEERLSDCGPAPDTTHVKKWRNWPGHWRSEEDILCTAETQTPDTGPSHDCLHSQQLTAATTFVCIYITTLLWGNIIIKSPLLPLHIIYNRDWDHELTETLEEAYSINIFVAVKQQFTPDRDSHHDETWTRDVYQKMVNLNAQSIKNYYFLVHQIYLYHAHV